MVTNTRKPVRKSSKRNGDKKPFWSFLSDQRFGFFLGIVLLALTFFLAIAFISFIFTGVSDQSKLGLSWIDLFKSDIRVENRAGKAGAWLAEVIINKGFGYSSFLFLYLFSTIGFRMIGRKEVHFYRNFSLGVISLLWLSLTLGFIFIPEDATHYIYPGGRFGFVVANWLNSMAGKIGTLLLLLITAFAVVGVTFKSSIPWMIEKLKPRPRPAKKVTLLTDDDEDEAERRVTGYEFEDISKVIDDGDVVKAIFDPDSDEPEVHLGMEVETPLEEQHLPDENGMNELLSGLEIENGVEEEEFVPDGTMPDYDPTLELSGYRLPPLDLLADHQFGNAEVSNEELISNKNKIVETLRHYKIEITKIRATIGPTITLYEIVPAPGIRIAKIKNLEDDIALSLAALGIRIIAPIPGRGTVGIEVPNQNPEVVTMKSILGSRKFMESTAELPVALGKTISNETYMFDLVKMPHILVAGATGQGDRKSVV